MIADRRKSHSRGRTVTVVKVSPQTSVRTEAYREHPQPNYPDFKSGETLERILVLHYLHSQSELKTKLDRDHNGQHSTVPIRTSRRYISLVRNWGKSTNGVVTSL